MWGSAGAFPRARYSFAEVVPKEALNLPPRVREQLYREEADRQSYHARRNAQASRSHRKTRLKQLAKLGIDPDKTKSVPPKNTL